MKYHFSAPIFSVLLIIFLQLVPSLQAQDGRNRDETGHGFDPALAENAFTSDKRGGSVEPLSDTAPVSQPEALEGIHVNNKAVSLALANDLEDALEAFLKAADLDPDNSNIFLNLSIVYARLNRNTEALTAARHAFELDGSNLRAKTHVCDLTFVTRQFQEAVTCFTELEAMEPLDYDSLSRLAASLMGAKKDAEALGVLEDMHRRWPQDTAVLNGLGIALYNQRQFDEAAERLKQAVEINPNLSVARYNLALVQVAKHNRAGALSQYRLLKEARPDLARDLYRWLYRDQVIHVGDDIRP